MNQELISLTFKVLTYTNFFPLFDDDNNNSLLDYKTITNLSLTNLEIRNLILNYYKIKFLQQYPNFEDNESNYIDMLYKFNTSK